VPLISNPRGPVRAAGGQAHNPVSEGNQPSGHRLFRAPVRPIVVAPNLGGLQRKAPPERGSCHVAICEAVTSPNMRFVPDQDARAAELFDASSHAASLHPSADCIFNSIRAHLAEFGIVAPVGRNGIEQSLEVVADAKDTRLPEIACACVTALGTQLLALKAQIPAFDRRIMA
jgi:hypothetical protein